MKYIYTFTPSKFYTIMSDTNQNSAVDQEKLQRFYKIQAAAMFEAAPIHDGLFTILGYRQRVAAEMLTTNDTTKFEELGQLYDTCDVKIKQLLGL